MSETLVLPCCRSGWLPDVHVDAVARDFPHSVLTAGAPVSWDFSRLLTLLLGVSNVLLLGYLNAEVSAISGIVAVPARKCGGGHRANAERTAREIRSGRRRNAGAGGMRMQDSAAQWVHTGAGTRVGGYSRVHLACERKVQGAFAQAQQIGLGAQAERVEENQGGKKMKNGVVEGKMLSNEGDVDALKVMRPAVGDAARLREEML
ncbi:hypothetical protein DFH08DRAFT_823031 [Mycena albidolilacea]|uniref:Uncharacterized protein n=1 Tax=Mycena albidolilacea TaxID=1033008 RepID=A0AAD6Z6Y2_9AGAR|nr:hypothetical protein DFH08DRAFT_823031 [Mycena albidolilacea]